MRKKLVFVSLVLFCSLAMLQYFAMDNAITPSPVSEEPVVEDTAKVVQPVKSELYIAGDYVILIKNGKYYVYPRAKQST
ncbi:MAG: hypothetical protein JJ975_08910 [Bacteroidia bacterium]|nr:hypothetical protein [Bacteroidia bacterium]